MSEQEDRNESGSWHDPEFPWRILLVNAGPPGYPGFPAYATREAAQEVIDDEAKNSYPVDGHYTLEWRPELDENPHAAEARDLLEQANRTPDVQEEIALLLRAQIEATFALRDQIAGFAPDTINDEES